MTVGTAKETAVHFRLCVSLWIVRQVVEQGQCIKENSMVQIAVSQVQPLSTSSWRSWARSFISNILPVHKYDIITIGITISLAGKPRIKAKRMTPSIPSSFPSGSKKEEQ